MLPFPYQMLFSFLLYSFHAISIFFLCPSKYSAKKTVAAWCAIVLLSMIIGVYTARFGMGGTILSFIVTLGLSLLGVFLLAEDRFSKGLFVFIAYAQTFLAIYFLSGLLSFLLFEESCFAKEIIRAVLHFALILVCLFVSRKGLNRIFYGLSTGWWPLNVVSILLLIYFSLLSLRIHGNVYSFLDVLFFVLLITIVVAVYAVFFHTIHFMHSAAEKQRAELQSQFLLRQVETMQESIEEARRIRHDARHHNMQIQEYLQKGEYDALLSYLGAYEKDAENEQAIEICDNLAANSILSAYVRKARQNGIAVHLDVTMERDAFISDMDIVAILANLMENAIYGCLKSGSAHPAIDVYIGRKVKKLVIYICNTSAKDVVFENGLPKSESGGGVGVTSILHSAARYGGEYDFRNEDGRFTCQILLGLPKPSPRTR